GYVRPLQAVVSFGGSLSRRALLLAALLLNSTLAFAQNPGSVVGRVSGIVQSDAGIPLTGASVTLRNAADSSAAGTAVTGSDGRFLIERLQPGKYSLRITYLGFKPHNVLNIAVSAADPRVELGQMKLAVAPLDVAAVEATATKSPVVVEADRTVHDTKDMVAAKGGKAIDVLRNVPELEVDMNGKVTMRGNQSVKIQLNGREPPLRGDALTNYLQQMPGDRIAKVEVIPNPSAKYDPEGGGGIINIVMKDNADLGLSGSISANGSTKLSRGGDFRINYQKGKLTFFTGTNFSFNDNAVKLYDLRRNLLATPITLFEQNGASDNDGWWQSIDLTTEFKVGKQAHLWLQGSTWGNGSKNQNLTDYSIMNDDRFILSSYDRASNSESSWRSGDMSTGFKQIFQPNKHEITFDLRRNFGSNAMENRIRKFFEDQNAPVELTHTDLDQDNAETSLNVDYTRPLGPKGKIDSGLRIAARHNDYDNMTEVFWSELEAVPTTNTNNFYRYSEHFNSGYVTASRPWKKFGFTAGLRAELATTDFKLPTTGEVFHNDYNSLFPSGAISYDLGKGKTARVNYSKRVGRPWPDILNPYIPVTDPLNRQVGNPYLKPNYTHSISGDLSLVGTKGTVRIAPYYRQTVNQWTNIKRVDSAGVSTVTWENVAEMKTYGTSITGSLRPGTFKRISGSVSMNGYREIRDADNLTQDYVRSTLRWSANANSQFKVNATTNAQLNMNYRPPQTLVQGKTSGMFFTNLGIRQQIMDKKASWNLNLNDPLNLYRFNFTTNDRTHEQLSRTRFSARQASLSFTYNFGKPPQQQSRRSGQDTGGGGETVQIR
ncbi:MAG TPA: TonB-dependent receptor, partial [Longimicrobiales bacterium]|nr:TonB-dependent receptor [Longimicrobiales bacterium]